MRVTLTFDNGPTAGVTERVLDTLQAHRVPARFFVIGEKLTDAEARRATTRAVAEGHLVGGHTWSHSVPFGLLDDASVDLELDRTRRLVEDVGGDGTVFRPYGAGGVIDERLMSAHGARRLSDEGYTCVLWNSVPGDWLDPQRWVSTALDDLTRRPWSVVVLHDVTNGAVDRLDEFLASAAQQAEFVTDTPDDCTPIRAGRPTTSFHLLGVGDPGHMT